MTMPILDEITKLIDEHGSANILRERVALAKDQQAAQEKRVSLLTIEIDQAKTEIARLRSDLEQCQKENREMKEQAKDAPPKYPKCPNCSTSARAFFMRPMSPDEKAITSHEYTCPKCNYEQ